MFTCMRTRYIVPALLFAVCAGAAEPEALRGASAVLAELTKPAAPATAAAAGRPTRSELLAFAARADRDAAGWLALAGRWHLAGGPDSAGADLLFAALPAPATWPALISGLQTMAAAPAANDRAKRRAAAWSLLAATLAGDRAAQRTALNSARETLDDDPWTLRGADDALIDAEDDPQAVVQAVQKRLVAAVGEKEAQVTLPDLVALVGEERAAPVVRSALALTFGDFTVHGKRTSALAVREATARLATLAAPPWSLVDGPDSLALFEGLEKRFPATDKQRGGSDWRRRHAAAAYLTQLIAAGRIPEALARIEQAGEQANILLAGLPVDQLAEKRPAELCDILRGLLQKDPHRPLWRIYAQLAAQLGRGDELQAMIHDHSAAADTQQQLVDLLLAGDEIDGALSALRGQLQAPAAAKTADDEDGDGDAYELKTSPAETALKLLTLGEVLDRPELVEEACAALARLPPTAGNEWSSGGTTRTLALQRTGHAVLAERLLAAELALPAANQWQGNAKPQILAALVRLYVSADRPADAVTILTQADRWGDEDLRGIRDGSDAHRGVPPLAVIAGQALAAVGKSDEAHRCALLALDQEPGCDAAYALLLRLDPAGAPAVFARLQRRDALEERPLIWQAQALLDAGKPVEAEALARQAMLLDPSDGDEGPGDRMRARAVLAEALEKLGRVDDAKPLRTAITAIRTAEQADRLLRAGLATRATAGYRASEAILDRTYCVQSRLAVTLAKLGRTAEAAVHFRRAFELMPQAFGRRESHCFGCEGVFGGTDARRIADEVFTALAAKDPKHPRVAYLQGYLRGEQERYSEAADAYRRAIALDPDYYNALHHLLELDEQLRLPRAERQQLTLALARLNPRDQGGWNAGQVSDLAALYNLLAEGSADLKVSTGPVLALAKPTGDDQSQRFHRSRADGNGDPATPGARLATHPLLQAVGNLLNNGR